ncbi:MAG: hypothetical protein HN707_03495 [Verrucomicrobia bacterium]|nr:hypothetical protein [Verrucomicrobiota bacterium]MBT7028941.1 hypothetical protein [Verrucomicrobiota bacterium]MBT7733950.1 hypothetical protein [Verrucomicrobiota bacterium]
MLLGADDGFFLPPAARRGAGVSGQGQDRPQAQVK